MRRNLLQLWSLNYGIYFVICKQLIAKLCFDRLITSCFQFLTGKLPTSNFQSKDTSQNSGLQQTPWGEYLHQITSWENTPHSLSPTIFNQLVPRYFNGSIHIIQTAKYTREIFLKKQQTKKNFSVLIDNPNMKTNFKTFFSNKQIIKEKTFLKT